RQALHLVDQRARENSTLNEWWSSDQGQEWKKTLDRIQAVTPLLGEEVVFVLTKDPGRSHGQVPLVLAQIQPGREDALRQGIDRMLGLRNMRYLFFEQRSSRGRDENEATLTFQGSRTGIASWLAPPGAAGSAEYISAEAVVAFSASTRDPRQALDEMLSTAV